jgi:acetaldehyde dehydrogenase (acetylating)
MGLVRAAYSAGKPAYGVGPGNAPSFIERTADVPKAVLDVVTGKTFDNGVLCSSPNSVVVDGRWWKRSSASSSRTAATSCRRRDRRRRERLLGPQRLPNPKLVGRPPR